MRHFLVLGFTSNDKDELGKELYLGNARDEAEAKTNDPEGSFARKEMHELAQPFKRRFFGEQEG